MSWRPDSAELAFVSDMEQTASIYQYDIHGIAPDGSGLRRISNPPDASQLGTFPKASVDVTVRNHDLSDSVLFVYVGGAAQAQDTVIPAGTSKTIHFDNVAVFQGHAQFPVVIDGNTRWVGFSSGQFQPGTTNQASVDVYANTGRDNYGTFYPVWRTDGTEVNDPVGAECIGEKWPASAPPGTTTSSVIRASASMCAMDRGWAAAQADQILYYDAVAFAYPGSFGAIMQVKEGSTDAGTPVFDPGQYGAVTALEYLPDGSGFLFSYRPDVTDTAIDLYRCIIPCSQPVQLTHFDGAYVGGFAISSDGQYVVFERTTGDPLDPGVSHPYDLWMMKIDGSQEGLFVSNARIPSWSRGAPQVSPTPTPPPGSTPTATPTPFTVRAKVYLPGVFR
ncbi:MAG TPA: hypothetical protein VNL16_06075 [Chloroflexota bacterium]|nr:hypothetical protein [Chloroflexota bacterium]